jgi:hypothetical protein
LSDAMSASAPAAGAADPSRLRSEIHDGLTVPTPGRDHCRKGSYSMRRRSGALRAITDHSRRSFTALSSGNSLL